MTVSFAEGGQLAATGVGPVGVRARQFRLLSRCPLRDRLGRPATRGAGLETLQVAPSAARSPGRRCRRKHARAVLFLGVHPIDVPCPCLTCPAAAGRSRPTRRSGGRGYLVEPHYQVGDDVRPISGIGRRRRPWADLSAQRSYHRRQPRPAPGRLEDEPPGFTYCRACNRWPGRPAVTEHAGNDGDCPRHARPIRVSLLPTRATTS